MSDGERDREVAAPPLMPLTLDDLKPQTVEVSIRVIEGAADSARGVSLAVLSWSEWSEIGLAIVDDAPPDKVEVVNGKKKYVPDPRDPDHQRMLVRNSNERQIRRLARSLILAGNLPELADKPLEEAAVELMKLPNGFLNGLNAAMQRIHNMSHSEVMAKADNFLGLRDSEGPGDEPEGDPQPEGVVSAAANGARSSTGI